MIAVIFFQNIIIGNSQLEWPWKFSLITEMFCQQAYVVNLIFSLVEKSSILLRSYCFVERSSHEVKLKMAVIDLKKDSF